jgi:undecaprenyl diphosphate synthase
MSQASNLPQHVAIIMDGNRRWAKKKGLSILYGHDYVSNNVIEPLVDRCIERGIKYLTLWAFSTENWRRDQGEVEGLMKIFRKGLQENSERLIRKGVRLGVIGDVSRFPLDIQKGLEQWMELSKQNDKITVNFALNYGGRDEITRAFKKMVTDGKCQPEDVSEANLAAYLDTVSLPDPDLLIRPGGEMRLSGYLPWQSVYSELYFTDTLMPDFSPEELDKALADYANRKRRFGK